MEMMCTCFYRESWDFSQTTVFIPTLLRQLLCKSVCYYTYPRAFFPRLYQPLLAILMGEVRHLVKMCPLQRMQSCLELYYNCLEETFFQSCTVFEYVQK